LQHFRRPFLLLLPHVCPTLRHRFFFFLAPAPEPMLVSAAAKLAPTAARIAARRGALSASDLVMRSKSLPSMALTSRLLVGAHPAPEAKS
jgi:hypothetical protein